MARNVSQKQLHHLLGMFGLVLVALILSGVVLAVWGRDFAQTQVTSQLTQEKISFPAAGSAALDKAKFPGLQQYAGQPVDSGVKAKAYADEFIWVHMMTASGGKTYAEVSTLAAADKTNASLAALKSTLFQGDMLRSSLLTAYAFSVFGQLAGYAVSVLLLAAALIAALTLVAFLRADRDK